MPRVYNALFRVRHYQCDAYGHLNNVNYVRYMQEAALEASAAVGWDAARYAEAGYLWLIRETDIEYLQAARFGDTVEVRTWVEDFRRVRSRRLYEFRRAGEEPLLARAVTDWVFLDAASGQPTSIPDEVMRAYLEPGEVPQASARDKMPEPPPAPPGIFRLRKRVEWRDIDNAGHANNSAYFAYLEDCSTQVGRHFQWPMRRMLDAGFAMVLRQMRVQYLQPAYMDDEIEISAWLSGGKAAQATRHYLISRPSDGALLARAQGLWVCFDLKRQRPMRIPQQVLDDFASNIAQPAP